MIHWIELENYTSFLEPQRIEFSPGKAVDDLTVFTSPAGERLNKFCAVFGANASGKTNFLRAIGSVARFIGYSFRAPEEDELPFTPHMFSGSPNVRITLQFEVLRDLSGPSEDGAVSDVFRYEIEASKQAVVKESLRRKTSHLFSRVFERTLDAEEYRINGLGERFAKKLPKNVSFISWLSRHEIETAVHLRKYFQKYDGLEHISIGRMPGFFRTYTAINVYRKNEAMKVAAVDMLKKWDFGIDDVEFVKSSYMKEGKEEEFWQAMVHHHSGDQKATLSILDESSGTTEMFSHLSNILPVLTEGGIALIDEIEYGLHPHMVEALLNLFLREETNPKNAQLIFTTHATWIMDFLNKWQIVLVEKRSSESAAWRLSDMRGVELRERYASRYRAGAYGAVPRDLSETFPSDREQ